MHYIAFIWLADFAVDVGVDVVVFVHVVVAAVIGGVVVGGIVVVVAIIHSVKIVAFIAVCSRFCSLSGALVPGVVFVSLQLNCTWVCLEDVLVLV